MKTTRLMDIGEKGLISVKVKVYKENKFTGINTIILHKNKSILKQLEEFNQFLSNSGYSIDTLNYTIDN